MTLAQLRYLLAVVDANLNITAASVQANTTQPGISKQLKLLEDELGFRIFQRKGKSLDRITPAGTEVIAHARNLLAEADRIREIGAAHRPDPAGELRILASQTQAHYVLPAALSRLRSHYPALNIRQMLFRDKASPDALDVDVDVDVALISLCCSDAPPERAIPLFTWQRKLVVPAGHPLTQINRELRLGDLAAFPLISYESLAQPTSSVSRSFSSAGHSPHFACTAQDSQLIKQYVRHGLGVGILAEMAVAENAEEDFGLVTLHTGALFTPCITWAVLPQGAIGRQSTIDLLAILAPHLSTQHIRRRLRENEALTAEIPPSWQEHAIQRRGNDVLPLPIGRHIALVRPEPENPYAISYMPGGLRQMGSGTISS